MKVWHWLGRNRTLAASEPFAWGIAGIALLLGVPPFLRMPPWCDLTLYDRAAHAMLSGGLHYRDVFDTNLPGFVWLLASIRYLLGNSWEAVRAVDLGIVVCEAALLYRLARQCGATRASLAWMIAGFSLFYPYLSEFNHCQRDVWMLLPALVAITIRLQGQGQFLAHFHEGLAWACAVWIKPHVMIPAIGVFLFMQRPWRGCWNRREFWRDLGGNLLGGLLLGGTGIGWLVGTGTWPHFLDVFQNWNSYYVHAMQNEFYQRLTEQLYYFVPWSFLQPLALWLACRTLWRNRGELPQDLPTRTKYVVSALFILWVLQAVLVQRRFHYVHVPETFLMLAIFAIESWTVVPLAIVYLTISVAVLRADRNLPAVHEGLNYVDEHWLSLGYYFTDHGLLMFDRHLNWWEAIRGADSIVADRLLKDRLSLHPRYEFASVTCYEILQIAEELRRRGCNAGNVICWHDSAHAVLAEMNVSSPFRFMHVSTTLMGDLTNPHAPQYRMMSELVHAAPLCPYLVTDLRRLVLTAPHSIERRWREEGENHLPPCLGPWSNATFPMNQPVVFRTRGSDGKPGRYLLHRLVNPIRLTEFDVPTWEDEP